MCGGAVFRVRRSHEMSVDCCGAGLITDGTETEAGVTASVAEAAAAQQLCRSRSYVSDSVVFCVAGWLRGGPADAHVRTGANGTATLNS